MTIVAERFLPSHKVENPIIELRGYASNIRIANMILTRISTLCVEMLTFAYTFIEITILIDDHCMRFPHPFSAAAVYTHCSLEHELCTNATTGFHLQISGIWKLCYSKPESQTS